jgi:hypothetical protein
MRSGLRPAGNDKHLHGALHEAEAGRWARGRPRPPSGDHGVARDAPVCFHPEQSVAPPERGQRSVGVESCGTPRERCAADMRAAIALVEVDPADAAVEPAPRVSRSQRTTGATPTAGRSFGRPAIDVRTSVQRTAV